MRWVDAFILAASAGFTLAHVGPGEIHNHPLPRIAGAPRKIWSEIEGKKRWLQSRPREVSTAEPEQSEGSNTLKETPAGEERLEKKASRCGAGRGSCSSGQCCSYEG